MIAMHGEPAVARPANSKAIPCSASSYRVWLWLEARAPGKLRRICGRVLAVEMLSAVWYQGEVTLEPNGRVGTANEIS